MIWKWYRLTTDRESLVERSFRAIGIFVQVDHYSDSILRKLLLLSRFQFPLRFSPRHHHTWGAVSSVETEFQSD
jgi:hypothetical protein